MNKKFLEYIFIASIFISLLGGVVFAQDFIFSTDIENLEVAKPDSVRTYNKVEVKGAWNAIKDALNNGRLPELSNVKIGIIDSGMDIEHQEFSGVNTGNTSDGAKRDVSDGLGHGTSIAGIIGANNISLSSPENYEPPQMNGILSGVGNDFYTIEHKFDGGPDFFTVMFTARELAKQGVPVVNISYDRTANHPIAGTPCFDEFPLFLTSSSTSIAKKILGAQNDSLFIVAAGEPEAGVGNVECFIPANLGDNLENVLTVAGTELDDSRASSSNFGSAVGIAAPGKDIYAPVKTDAFQIYVDFIEGTSFSAPFVTGTAALIKAIRPDLTPAEIKEIITKYSDFLTTPSANEQDKELGDACLIHFSITPLGFRGCRLNTFQATNRVLPVEIISVSPAAATQGEILDITIEGKHFSRSAMSIDMGEGIAVNNFNIVSSEEIVVDISISETATPGTRDITLTKEEPAGSTSTLNDAFELLVKPSPPPPPPPPPSGDPSPWPQFQHDARHSGQSQFQGPQTNTLDTIFEKELPLFELSKLRAVSSPVIGSDNTIYYTASSHNAGKLYAINPDGSLKWDSDNLPISDAEAPAIITNGLSIVVSDFGRKLIALDRQNGEEKWTHTLSNEATHITKAPDNTLYIMTGQGHVISITPTQDSAIENWETSLGSRFASSAPAVGLDGKIYAAEVVQLFFRRTKVVAIDPSSGDIAWTKTILRDRTANKTPAIADDGTVLVAFANRLRGFNPDNGDTEFAIPYSGQNPSVPAILPGNRALVRTGSNGWLHFIDLEQEEAITRTGTHIGQPVSDNEGTIYIRKVDNNNQLKLEAIKSDRSTLFELDIDESFKGISNFAMGANNNLYFTTFFFNDDRVPFSRLNVVGE